MIKFKYFLEKIWIIFFSEFVFLVILKCWKLFFYIDLISFSFSQLLIIFIWIFIKLFLIFWLYKLFKWKNYYLFYYFFHFLIYIKYFHLFINRPNLYRDWHSNWIWEFFIILFLVILNLIYTSLLIFFYFKNKKNNFSQELSCWIILSIFCLILTILH